MATLRRSRILLAAAIAVLASAPAASKAAEPVATTGPAPVRATCADRFPAEAPAGVDLRLGCIAGEIVGVYTAASGEPPAPISSWAILLGLGVGSVAFAGWLVARALSRRAGRRLAPVLARSWWVCEACRSVNGAEKPRCYSCGAPPRDGPTMATSDSPETPQSFGGRRGR